MRRRAAIGIAGFAGLLVGVTMSSPYWTQEYCPAWRMGWMSSRVVAALNSPASCLAQGWIQRQLPCPTLPTNSEWGPVTNLWILVTVLQWILVGVVAGWFVQGAGGGNDALKHDESGV